MKRALVAASVLTSLIAVTAAATTIRRYTLEEVRDRAEAIFVGRLLSSSTRLVADGKMVTTDYQIEVTDVLHGSIGATTSVSYIGGKYGSREMTVPGVPKLEYGETYIFFRSAQPNNTTVGFGQGLYRLVGTAANAVLVSGDGEPLVMVNGQLGRGRKVAVMNGKLAPSVDEATAADPKDTNGVATNADGTPARRVRPAAAAAAHDETFASMSDLRSFVRQRRAKPVHE